MTRPRRAAAVGAVLAIALLAGWLLTRDDAAIENRRARGGQTVAPVAEPASKREKGDRVIASKDAASPANTARNASLAATAVDLFDHDVPLVERIAELDRLARRGDAAAGCQAGFELIRCERARELRSHFENVEARVATPASGGNLQGAQLDARIDAVLERQARQRAVLAACEGIDTRQWAAPVRYLHAAAQAGHAPSMVQSLAQSRYQPDALVRDPGLVTLFRANAPRYFQALLEAGDPQLLHRWSVAWMQTADPLPDVLPPPYNRPELAQAMFRQMLERQPGWTNRSPVPPPDPSPAEVRAEARQLYERHFAAHEARARVERDRLASFKWGDISAYGCKTLAPPWSGRR